MTKIKKIVILFVAMFTFFTMANKVNADDGKILITLADMQKKANHYYCLDHRGHQSKWRNDQYYKPVGTLNITTNTTDDGQLYLSVDWNGGARKEIYKKSSKEADDVEANFKIWARMATMMAQNSYYGTLGSPTKEQNALWRKNKCF